VFSGAETVLGAPPGFESKPGAARRPRPCLFRALPFRNHLAGFVPDTAVLNAPGQLRNGGARTAKSFLPHPSPGFAESTREEITDEQQGTESQQGKEFGCHKVTKEIRRVPGMSGTPAHRPAMNKPGRRA
jgi:hypothetical protein